MIAVAAMRHNRGALKISSSWNLVSLQLTRPCQGGGFDRSASSSGRFPDVYFVREYEMGILIREHPVSVDQIEAVLGPLKERLGSKRPVRRRLKKGGKKVHSVFSGPCSHLNPQISLAELNVHGVARRCRI